MGYLSNLKFAWPAGVFWLHQYPGGHLCPRTRFSSSENEKRDPEAQVNAAGPQATDQQRGKSRWPGSENESYAASGCEPSSVSILRWTSGQSNGNENEANETRERGSVNTDTGLYSLRDFFKRVSFKIITLPPAIIYLLIQTICHLFSFG